VIEKNGGIDFTDFQRIAGSALFHFVLFHTI